MQNQSYQEQNWTNKQLETLINCDNDKEIEQKLTNLGGKDLEKFNQIMFQKAELSYFSNSGQVEWQKLESNLGFPKGENVEFDYIIPLNTTCIIGEITSRSNVNGKGGVQKKFRKFSNFIQHLQKVLYQPEFDWKLLEIPDENLRLFRDIENVKGLFISTKAEYSPTNKKPNITILNIYQYLKLIEYVRNLGSWTKPYFMNLFNITGTKNNEQEAIRISKRNNSLICMTDKKVINGRDVPLADLYIFETSPYKLLDIAHVCREDGLPFCQEKRYQRAIKGDKLKEIREKLLNDIDFVFPSNILVTLSPECQYDSTWEALLIPKDYGSISVIDGQHRLFAYASTKIEEKLTRNENNDCKILVSGIKFKSDDQNLIDRCATKIFIEVNSNQTPIDKRHLDLAGLIAGETESENVAEAIIRSFNERRNRPFILGDPKDSYTDIDDRPIKRELEILFKNIERSTKNVNNKSSKKNKKKLKDFYEKVFEIQLLDPLDVEQLVQGVSSSLEFYVQTVLSIFKGDNFTKFTEDKKTTTCLGYANFWAGLIKLLDVLIQEGLDRNKIQDEIQSIKQNLMKYRKMDDSNQILLTPNENDIPDPAQSPKQNFNFLKEYRKYSTLK